MDSFSLLFGINMPTVLNLGREPSFEIRLAMLAPSIVAHA